MKKLLPVFSLAVGIVITWLDSSPGWDDTAVSAGLVLVASGLFGLLDPGRAWLWALLIGTGVPLVGILGTQNYGSLLALVLAFAGAYAGVLAKKVLSLANG